MNPITTKSKKKTDNLILPFITDNNISFKFKGDRINADYKSRSLFLNDENIFKNKELPANMILTDVPEKVSSTNFTFFIYLTTDCNLNCSYCSEREKREKKYHQMTTDIAEQFLSLIFRNIVKYKTTIEIVFYGGEPLLNYSVLQFTTNKARELSSKYGMNLILHLMTNLTLIDDEKAKWLAENDFFISGSIDGPREIHNKFRKDSNNNGSFSKALAGLYSLQDHCKINNLAIRPTITESENLRNVISFIYSDLNVNTVLHGSVDYDQLYGLEIQDYFIGYDEALEWWIKEYSSNEFYLYPTLLQFKDIFLYFNSDNKKIMDCGSGRNVFSFLPNGDIFPCCNTCIEKKDINLKIGNILSGQWNQHSIVDDLQNLRKNHSTDCLECPYVIWCQGGCKGASINQKSEYLCSNQGCFADQLWLRILYWYSFLLKNDPILLLKLLDPKNKIQDRLISISNKYSDLDTNSLANTLLKSATSNDSSNGSFNSNNLKLSDDLQVIAKDFNNQLARSETRCFYLTNKKIPTNKCC